MGQSKIKGNKWDLIAGGELGRFMGLNEGAGKLYHYFRTKKGGYCKKCAKIINPAILGRSQGHGMLNPCILAGFVKLTLYATNYSIQYIVIITPQKYHI